MFRINHNILSLIGQRNLYNTSSDLSVRMERLSSGLRINRAADDAAGLTVSEQMRSQIIGARQSSRNIQNAISLLQTAEGGLEQIGNMYNRLKELATQAADGTLNASNRSAVSLEAQALITEINRIATTTTFNGVTLINSGVIGSNSGTLFTFFIGDGTTATALTFQVANITLKGISVDTSTGVGAIGAQTAALTLSFFASSTGSLFLVTAADSAVNAVAQIRTEIGAFQNRLERAQANLLAMIENTTRAESIIRDADFVVEASAMTRAQILVQAGSSMLAQANVLPNQALSLLGG